MQAAYTDAGQARALLTLADGEAFAGFAGPMVLGLTADGIADFLAAGNAVGPYVPPPAPKPYLTGRDVLDGMSPAQARAANDADPRNLDRIAGARTAAEVKSCIRRVAEANGLTPDALLAQATPTGGL